MKTAVVTGASKGLGKAIAIKLAEKGYHLCICSRDIQEINTVAQEIEEVHNVKVYPFVADLSKKSDTVSFGDFCINRLQNIDVLVNNAGVYLGGSVFEEDEGQLSKMMDTNLYSAYYLSRALVPSMVARRRGHIFNICSIASIIAYPSGGSYSISKFALLGLSKVMREELKDKGIKVTAVLPGATWSDSWAGVDLPYERLMESNDIALLIANALELSPTAVIEEIIVRPQLGDI